MERDALKLKNQLCFPLYACSREVIKLYKPLLDQLNLTYTQYIAMLVLWEKKSVTVKVLGEDLHLDSGTLTPMLKKMETQGLISRKRGEEDERSLIVTITEKGEALKERAKTIPEQVGQCLPITQVEAQELYRLLYKVLEQSAPSENAGK